MWELFFCVIMPTDKKFANYMSQRRRWASVLHPRVIPSALLVFVGALITSGFSIFEKRAKRGCDRSKRLVGKKPQIEILLLQMSSGPEHTSADLHALAKGAAAIKAGAKS